jgi:hypothetical protein
MTAHNLITSRPKDRGWAVIDRPYKIARKSLMLVA